MQILKSFFGSLADGTAVPIYTLVNARGMGARITPYGGIVQSLMVPDRAGKLGDVVLGFDTLADYLDHSPFFGCLVGRYANRIANASFTLNGVAYALPTTGGPHTLHGGTQGFDKRLWGAQAPRDAARPGAVATPDQPRWRPGIPGRALRVGRLHARRRQPRCASTTRPRRTSRRSST